MYIELHVKYPLFLSDFNETWIFSCDFSKNSQLPNFIRIHPVAAELFMRKDRQTDSVIDGRTLRQNEASNRF
jgi:hypothetical protein